MRRLILLALLLVGCAPEGTAPMSNVPTALLVVGYLAGTAPAFICGLWMTQKEVYGDGSLILSRITTTQMWIGLFCAALWPAFGFAMSMLAMPLIVIDLVWRTAKGAWKAVSK